MSNWNDIKNNIAEINNITKQSPVDKKSLDNELIMCLFINKVNLKYRFMPYYEIPFLDYTTRIFDTSVEMKTNFFNIVTNDSMIQNYINSIKNVIMTQINIANKTVVKPENFKMDINLIICSAIENLDMRKYKILSEMLYNLDSKYLDLAKESIINSNKNISLDKMVYGFDIPERFDNVFSNKKLNYILIFLIILFIFVAYLS